MTQSSPLNSLKGCLQATPHSLQGILFALLSMQSLSLAADGTWNDAGATSGLWSTGSNWMLGTIPGATTGTVNGDTATFDGTLGTYGTSGNPILIDPNRNILNLAIGNSAGAYFIGTTGGNKLLLSDGGALTIDSASIATINAPLEIQGVGTGSYTFISNNAGVNIGGTITAANSVVAKLSLDGAGSTNNTISGVIKDGLAGSSVALLKKGFGAWSLTGVNTYTGSTTIQAGTLSISGGGALSARSAVDLSTSDAIFDISGVTAGVTIGSLEGAATSVVTLGSKTLTVGSNNASTAFYGNIQGAGGNLIKVGNGSLTLSGNNTYTGATTLSGGTLILNYTLVGGGINTTKLADSSALILNGGTLQLDSAPLSFPYLATGNHLEVVGSTTINGGANITRANGSTARIELNTITRNVGGFLNIASAGLATTDSNNDATGILGAWAMIDGTDLASSVNSGASNTSITAYTGYINISARGATILNNPLANVRINSLGTSGNNVLGSAITTVNTLLQGFGTGSTVDMSGKTLRAVAILIAKNQQDLTLGIADNSGTLTAAAAGGELSLVNYSTNKLTVRATIADNSSTSSLSIMGTGEVLLRGTNTFTGKTRVNGGQLNITSQAALGSNPGVFTADQLTLNGGTLITTGNFSINDSNRGITLGVAGGTFDIRGGTLSFGSTNTITGSGSLTKIGSSSTLALNYANTYSGVTYINTGKVSITNASALGTTAGNTVIKYDGWETTGGRLLIGGGITLAENLVMTGGLTTGSYLNGIDAISGNNTITGSITLTGNGQYRMGASNAGTVLNINGSIVRVDDSSGNRDFRIQPYSGTIVNVNAPIINHGGIFTPNGGGVLVMNVVGSDFDKLTVSYNGNVRLGVSNAFMLDSDLQVGDHNGVFDLAGFDQTFKNFNFGNASGDVLTSRKITNSAAGTVSTLTLGYNNGTSSSNGIGGVIEDGAGIVAITKMGTGTQTFYYGETYTGATNITNGTLALSGAGALSGTTAVNITATSLNAPALGNFDISAISASSTAIGSLAGVSGATVYLATKSLSFGGNNSSTVYAGNIVGTTTAGGIIKTGTGTQVLSGTNTYLGTTTVSAGTLQFGKKVSLYNSTPASWTSTNLIVESGATLAFNVGGAGEFDLTDINTLKALGTATGGFKTGSFLGLDTTGGNFTVSTAITNTNSNANVIGLTKLGSNTLTLSAANTYTGATTVSGGTLKLDYTSGNTNKLADGAALILNGGTVEIANGTGAYTETVVSTTLMAGTNNYVTRSGSSTAVLQLNAINVGTGATVNFSVNDLATTDNLNNASGILGAWATVGNNWAYNFGGGNDGLIRAYTTYVDITRLGPSAIVDGTTNNVRIIDGGTSGPITLALATTNINTLNQSASGGLATIDMTSKTLRLGVSGGVLVGSGAGALTIGTAVNQGTLTAGGNLTGVAGSLTFTNLSATNDITVNSVIANNGAGIVGLTKEGVGRLMLNGSNTYSGATTINSGTLQAGGSNTFSANSAVTLANTPGALLNLNNFNNAIASLAGGGAAGGNVTLGSGTMTLGGAGSASYAGVISGSGGITQTGAALTQTLTGVNTYSGATTVSSGTLQIGNGGNTGSISQLSAVSVASGATIKWNNSNALNSNMGINNTVSGAGTILLQGTNSVANAGFSNYGMFANNAGLTGTIALNGARLAVTTASQIGAATIDLQAGASLSLSLFNVLSNNITIGNGAGWRESANTYLGALRLEGNQTLNGNIVLNNTTVMTLGDATGQYSSIGANSAGNHFLNGVISGAGDFAMSRYTSAASGPVTITIGGSSSNTYTGKTVVDGQNANTSLILAKTGGAVAIAAGTTVQMGNNTTSQFNLRMGANEQFGAGVVMNFVNSSGNWGRFDLQGTTQTLAGINAGTLGTQGGGVIQNQNVNGVDPGADATLTLNGSATYLYNGYLRDQDNGGTTRKLNIVKAGTGTQTLVGGAVYYTGTTTVNGGKLILQDVNIQSKTVTINNTGTYQIDGGGDRGYGNFGPTILNDGGTFQANNTGYLVWNSAITNTGNTNIKVTQNSNPTNRGFFLDGGLMGTGTVTIDATGIAGAGVKFRNNNSTFVGTLIVNGIASGTINTGSGIGVGGASTALQNTDIQLNGTMELSNGGALGWANGTNSTFRMGALSGSGYIISNNSANNVTITVGANNHSGDFSGTIANGSSGTFLVVSLAKDGTGTQTLSGTNTYTGTTTVLSGVLNLDYSTASSKLSDSSALILSGGTVNLTGNGYTEIVGSTTLANGTASNVTRTIASTSVLNLGAITVGAGATVNFSANSIAMTSTLNNVGGVLGAWATVGGTDYAMRDVGGFIVANTTNYYDVTRLSSGNKVITDVVTNNVRIVDGTTNPANPITLAGATTTNINTLQMNATGGAVVVDVTGSQTLRLGVSGGVLLASGASGSLTIGTVAGTGILTAGGNSTNIAGSIYFSNFSNSDLIVNTNVNNNGSGAVSVVKQGSGRLILNGTNNTYSGDLTITGGTVQMGASDSIGNLIINAAPGGTSKLDINGKALTMSGTLRLGGQSNTAVADVVDSNAVKGSVTVNTITYASTYNPAGSTISANLNLGNALRTVTVNDSTAAAEDLTISGNISGVGAGINKVGTGTLVLSGTNTYTGLTTYREGTVVLKNGKAIADTATVNLTGNNGVGAILRVDNSETIGGITGNGSVNIASGQTLTVDSAVTTKFEGGLTGTGTFKKTGAGTIELSGTSAGVVSTEFNSTSVLLRNPNALGAAGSQTALAAGTTLSFANQGFVAQRTGSSGFLTATPPTTAMAGAMVVTTAEMLYGYDAAKTGDNTNWTYTSIMNNPGVAGTWTFAEHTDDQGGVKLNGATVVNNTVWNVFSSGAATVNAGDNILQLGFYNGGGGAGAVNQAGINWQSLGAAESFGIGYSSLAAPLNSQSNYTGFYSNTDHVQGAYTGAGGTVATFKAYADAHVAADINLAGNVNVDTSQMVGSTDRVYLDGVIRDQAGSTGSLTKTGSKELILAATNTYSGGTTISQGTLTSGKANATGTGLVQVAGVATWSLGADSHLIAGLTGSGSVTGSGVNELGSNIVSTGLDGSTQIVHTKNYIQKLDFGNLGGATVNSVVFNSAGTSGTGYTLAGAGTLYGETDVGNPAVFTEYDQLVDDFYFGGNPGVLTFTGLTSGRVYEAVLYTEVGLWEGRPQSAVFSSGASSDELAFTDPGDVGYYSYKFTADGTTASISMTPFTGNTFHWFAATLEDVGFTGLNNLTIDGNSATNTFSGNIGGPISLEKKGTGTQVLSGTNTYLGNTTVSGGTLLMSGANSMPATSKLTVNGGGNFSLGDGTARNTTTAQLVLTNKANLTFDWNAGAVDKLTSTAVAITTGNIGIIINPSNGPTGSGLTLLSSASGGLKTAGSTNYFLANNTNFTATLTSSDTAVTIGSYTAATALTGAYWKGTLTAGISKVWAFTDGSNDSNWASIPTGPVQGLAPGSGADVFFSVTNGTSVAPTDTTLGADMTIKSLTIQDTVNTFSLNADGHTLTITPGVPTAGITINASVPASTIAANVALGAAQTWTNNSANAMTVSGMVSGTNNLTKAGSGQIILTGANTYSGTTTINAGNLQVGIGGSGKTGTGAVTVNGASAILSGTGTVQGAATVTLGSISAGDNGGAGIGTLNFANGLTFNPSPASTVAQFTINGTTTLNETGDRISVTGNLTLNGNTNIVVSNDVAWAPVIGQSWTLFDWTGVMTQGAFNVGSNLRTGKDTDLNEGNLNLADLSGFGGLGWDVSSFIANGSISIVAVPEPSRALLMLLGVISLFYRRRRARCI
ncbi:autotransporter-associated beta strand repeat-containing protein [soil metagenome]